MNTLHIKTGDNVQIMSGKDKGKQGKVLEVSPKEKKVIVYKYKRKTGYHKKNGHRQQYTKVKIEKING